MKVAKNGNQKGLLLLGAGGVVALGLGATYLFLNQKKETQVSRLDRPIVVKILKELRKELFSVFSNFSMVSMQIKSQTMGRAKPEEIKMMLLEQPMFKTEVQNVEESVYSQFNISREEFQHACEHTYQEDPEIKLLQREMKDSFDKSFLGIQPDPKTDIPEFLTPQVCFEILEKVMLESALKLNQKLLDFKESGEEISFNNPKMMQVMQSLKMDSSKKEILKDYGLDKYDEAAQKILQYATQIYTQENKDGFAEKMQGLDQKYQSIMEQLLVNGPVTEHKLRDLMNQEVPQALPPFGGMTGFGGGRRGTPANFQKQEKASIEILKKADSQEQPQLQQNDSQIIPNVEIQQVEEEKVEQAPIDDQPLLNENQQHHEEPTLPEPSAENDGDQEDIDDKLEPHHVDEQQPQF